MKVWIHCAAGIILTAFLFPVYDWGSLWIIAGMVLIDFDHYVYYVFKIKDYSLRRAVNFYKEITRKKDIKAYHNVLRMFHTLEIITVMVILSFFFEFIMIITIGILIHISMDVLAEKRRFGNLSPRFSLMK
jgi:hypothetical protein